MISCLNNSTLGVWDGCFVFKTGLSDTHVRGQLHQNSASVGYTLVLGDSTVTMVTVCKLTFVDLCSFSDPMISYNYFVSFYFINEVSMFTG